MTIRPLHLDLETGADSGVDLSHQVLSDYDNLRAWVQKTRLGDAVCKVDVDFLQWQEVFWFQTVSQTQLCRTWGLSSK